MNARSPVLTAGLIILATLSSCGSRDLKIPLPSPGSFALLEQYTFQPKCVQCHSTMSSYEGVMSSHILVPGSPEQSQLYRVVKSGSMPQQSTSLSQSEIQAIYTWIQAGAPNN